MKKITMLLIEDDPDDVQLLEEALAENKVDCTLEVIMEGDKVIPYLQHCKPLPDIIVLDLNLPRFHGKELLSMIRALKNCALVPIIVFTTSASPHDIQYAKQNGANSFITKPSTSRGFNETIEKIVSMVV